MSETLPPTAPTPPQKPWHQRKAPWIGIIIAVVLVVGGIANIGNDSDDTASAPATNSAPDSSTDTSTVEEAVEEPIDEPEPLSSENIFKQVLATQGFTTGMQDASVDVAESACGMFDTMEFDTAILMLLGMAQDYNVTEDQLGVIVGAGVPAFCPEYQADLDLFISTYGG